ncbi:MAG: aminotransferase class V-fold PLP-dependent enzyme [Clostridia bacterium]|nr:aminotransferase class V-fold PLP-dependent enzyme [Clostridia bacterium]
MLYFDHAATSWPKPEAVTRAMVRACVYAGGNPGRSAHVLSLRAAEIIYQARERAAEFFHGPEPENVLFYPNATGAINAVLHGLQKTRLKPGTHVLISEMEHNAVVRPLYAMGEQGVTFDTYPVFSGGGILPDDEILAGIRERLRPETALVAACHVSNVCGAALPIEKIGALCREQGKLFLVDASQSAGVWDIDMELDHIDYLCTAGHKALLGPQGSGLLLIGAGAEIPAACIQGGNGVASLDAAMPGFLPEALEAGTLPTPAIAGLLAGLDVLRREGISAVREEAFALYRRLLDMLKSFPGITVYAGEIPQGTTISFRAEGVSCTQLAGALGSAGVCVRSGFHCAPLPHRAFGTEHSGTVRVSVGYGNHLRDADRFYRIMKEILPVFP